MKTPMAIPTFAPAERLDGEFEELDELSCRFRMESRYPAFIWRASALAINVWT